MNRISCPICGVNSNHTPDPPKDRHAFDCPNCGRFEMSSSVYEPGNNFAHAKAAILSHYVFRMQEREDPILLDNYRIDEILKSKRVPGHIEQAENLIRFIGRELDRKYNPGGRITKDPNELRAKTGALRPTDVQYLVAELVSQGFMTKPTAAPQIGLTFKGWDRYHDLTTRGTMARVAFMAMQYGDQILDEMFENCFRPAIEDTGFELRRLDQFPKAGVIDNLLRDEIQNSRFLLVDLTHSNRGAYWEGGYAEGLGKPVIYMCEKSVFDGEGDEEPPHFDTNHCQTVVWEASKPKECTAQLKATIRVSLPGETKRTDD